MSERKWRNFAIVIRRVLGTPFAASTLAIGLLWALLLHNGIGLIGMGVTIGAVVIHAILKLNDEEFVREAIRDAREHDRRSEARQREFRFEELDVEARVKVKAIARLQEEIAQDVGSSPVDEVAVGLSDTVAQTEALVERALELAQKRRDLLRYLTKTDQHAIEMRVTSLQASIAEENDPARRAELESALTAKRQELDDYRAIEAAAKRILAELDSIECAFSSLRARLVRIRSTDIGDWMQANMELQTELGGLNSAVDTLETSINEALTTRNPE